MQWKSNQPHLPQRKIGISDKWKYVMYYIMHNAYNSSERIYWLVAILKLLRLQIYYNCYKLYAKSIHCLNWNNEWQLLVGCGWRSTRWSPLYESNRKTRQQTNKRKTKRPHKRKRFFYWIEIQWRIKNKKKTFFVRVGNFIPFVEAKVLNE